MAYTITHRNAENVEILIGTAPDYREAHEIRRTWSAGIKAQRRAEGLVGPFVLICTIAGECDPEPEDDESAWAGR